MEYSARNLHTFLHKFELVEEKSIPKQLTEFIVVDVELVVTTTPPVWPEEVETLSDTEIGVASTGIETWNEGK